jgi:prepilin-type N-terminal cleavage/methylation domain-containing protein
MLEERGLRTRTNNGFTIVEVMIVVAIAAIMVALGYPSWQRMNDNIRLKSAARAVQESFGYAREQAVRTGRRHLVLSQTAAAVDACGTAIPNPLMVLDDVNLNCCINAGEPVWVPEELNEPGVQQTAFWGVTNATFQVPEDAGGGNETSGSTFLQPTGVAANGVAFRGDGIPITVSNACVAGSVGTGAGGFYFTNGRAGLAAGERRDIAVVLSALGTTKVYSWNFSAAVWTQ